MQDRTKSMSKSAARPRADDLYETDFYAWAQSQAQLLRERRWSELDLENVAEEIETLGRSEKREIRSRLVVILSHLLKWKYQPGLRGASWRGTIVEQRLELRDVLEDNPSLGRYPADVFAKQYLSARLKASNETGIAFDLLPAECPFTLDQVLDIDFLPEEPGHIG